MEDEEVEEAVCRVAKETVVGHCEMDENLVYLSLKPGRGKKGYWKFMQKYDWAKFCNQIPTIIALNRQKQ